MQQHPGGDRGQARRARARGRGAARRVRRRPTRCGCSSTTPRASRSSSASASPTRCRSSASTTRSRSPRRAAQRPLTKPDHFRRFLGRRARVRTRDAREGHRSFTGELVGASDAEVTIAADTGVVAIPYDDIPRSNLVEE